MMQKEGGAPSCILYTRSIGMVGDHVKNNLFIYIDMNYRERVGFMKFEKR